LEKERMKLNGDLRAAEYELNSVRLSTAAALQGTNATAGPSAMKQPQEGGQGGAAMGKMLANMLKDPEMRKAMEQQQRMAMDMIYGSLVKQLQLSPEQEKKFKDMLLAQQMENVSQAGAMFDGDPEQRAKLAKELAEKRTANEEKMKELLGEEKFAQYQDYNQTIGERMMLDQFARNAEISPEQNEQLLAIMREEKKNVQINLGNPAADPTQDWQAVLGSDEATAKLFAQQEEVNNRVMERAAQVLTPEQMQKFGPVLKSQLEMQKAGLKMARQMFGEQSKSEVAK
jgi:replicative superfamily II helicase